MNIFKKKKAPKLISASEARDVSIAAEEEAKATITEETYYNDFNIAVRAIDKAVSHGRTSAIIELPCNYPDDPFWHQKLSVRRIRLKETLTQGIYGYKVDIEQNFIVKWE